MSGGDPENLDDCGVQVHALIENGLISCLLSIIQNFADDTRAMKICTLILIPLARIAAKEQSNLQKALHSEQYQRVLESALVARSTITNEMVFDECYDMDGCGAMCTSTCLILSRRTGLLRAG